MKIVIQIIILSFIVWVFPQYSYAQESNQALKAPSKLQATVEGKEKVYSDEGASIKEEIAYLKGRINALEAGKFGIGDFIKFVGIFVAIFLAVFGFAGVGYIQWVRERVREEVTEKVKKSHDDAINKVKESHEDAINVTTARVHLQQSYHAWFEYEPFSYSGSREEFYLDDAVKRAEKALKWAEEIHEKQKPTRQQLILECKSQMAYHLATQGNPDKASKALEMARELKQRMPEFGRPPSWIDTIAWVFYLLGSPDEKEEGLKLRDELLSREKELGKEFIHAVKTKYKKYENKEYPYCMRQKQSTVS